MKRKKEGTFQTIQKLRSMLTRRDKVILLVLFFATIVYSFVETLSISIIMPFISFASNPSLIAKNSISYEIYTFFAFKDTFEFMIAFSAVLIVFYVVRAIYSVVYTYMQNRFAYRKFHFFAYRLFSKAVEINYDTFVKRRLDKIRANITHEALQASMCIQSLLQMFGEFFTISILYVLLLITSWKMTLALTIIMGLQVFLVMNTLGRKIRKMGSVRSKMDAKFNEIISKTFGNFKIIKLKGNQQQVFKEFENASIERTNAEILTQTILPTPRFILESIGFSILIGCVAYILIMYKNVDAVLPIISMYALALYRILPAVSRILQTYNLMGYYISSVSLVYEDLLYHTDYEDNEPCEFKEKIELKGITFGYDEQKPILKDFNLVIHKGDKIAFCGESGAGKSTLVDLIIGIYKPQKGVICVDDEELNNHNLRSWRKKIGYIPQTIYLFDGSVAENVAFGSKMDEKRVIEACKKANIYEFLQEHSGIYTRVGEGGILLSGGQKQRIGIARAIYDNPEILVLDEATSALDSATEERIMEEIYDVAQNKTLLVIAHRLNTIERCERKIEIRKQ
ncbi:ATP-binding cassette domain-containing protein [uncultured Helicobacter sp.]|uniref:ABC transporter ATP-binding protein/permease n=1 Tax=uncultured Helicobacter sp. TaxID=175537 RepID=UPI001C39DAE7|nr:ABC transporter ATP-binding protein [Candidatus Helicobacter avicola]